MTTALNTNGRNSSTITVTDIQAAVTNARNSFALSKDSASKAAAHAYMVWLDTQSVSAPEHMRKWLAEQIEALNKAIDQHNEDEKALKDRVKRLVKGDLKKTDPLKVDPKTDAERAAQAQDKAELTALSSLTDEQWQARRKVRIERRNDASAFTEIVKYVFGFDRRADASVTARYAKVLEWINAKCGNEEPNDADEIVEAIKAAGGFEDVLHAQRGSASNDPDDEESEDREIQAEAIIQEAKNAVANAEAKAVFDMDVQNAPEGIVTLLARFKDGKVEVVGELPIGKDKLGATVSMFNDEALLPTYDRSEFVSRVLALGELVKEGDKTSKTVDDLKAGDALKAERVLSLVPDANMGIQLVMSARYADASVIVKATPNKARVDLGSVTTTVNLGVASRKALSKAIAKREHRRLVDIKPQIDDAEVQWIAEDRALMAQDRNNARRRFMFEDMAAQTHKPLDVDGFRPQFRVTVNSAELKTLYDSRLKVWKDNVSGKKGQKVMTLTFSNGAMAHTVDGQDALIVPCSGTAATVALTFRPRDLHDLVEALISQSAQVLDVSGDAGGMMRVGWADNLGAYEVFQPTATASGALNIKRVEQMRGGDAVSMVA
jgi:hypothetical protein